MKNKTILHLALIIILILSITGCSSEDVDPVEIYEKSIKAMEEANSYEFEMTVNQIMTLPEEIPLGNGESTDTMETNINGSGKALIEPTAMEMSMEMNIPALANIPGADGTSGMEIQIYMLDDLVYMYNPIFANWVLIDMTEMGVGLEQLDGVDKSTNDPMYFLEMLGEEGAEKASLETDSNNYILSFQDEEGDLIKKMMENIVAQLIGETQDPTMQKELSEVFEQMELSEIDYKVWIDKNSYLATKTYMAFNLSMTIEGETLIMEQKAESIYKGYGTFDTIVIPEDVKESAVKMDNLTI